MNSDRPKRDSMSIEEATVSNMWEIELSVFCPCPRPVPPWEWRKRNEC
jgi:hypothetical protein